MSTHDERVGRRHELAMDSHDRLFPSQDTLPKGGFGNLIALPPQWGPRKRGNTLFLDEHLHPCPDDRQWAHLAAVSKIDRRTVEATAGEATRLGRVMGLRPPEPTDEDDAAPWERLPSGKTAVARIAGPLPQRVRAVLCQRLFIEKAGSSSPLLDRIKRLAAFQNPEFYEKQRMRLVLVHRRPILDQWRARLSLFPAIDPREIGRSEAAGGRPTGGSTWR